MSTGQFNDHYSSPPPYNDQFSGDKQYVTGLQDPPSAPLPIGSMLPQQSIYNQPVSMPRSGGEWRPPMMAPPSNHTNIALNTVNGVKNAECSCCCCTCPWWVCPLVIVVLFILGLIAGPAKPR